MQNFPQSVSTEPCTGPGSEKQLFQVDPTGRYPLDCNPHGARCRIWGISPEMHLVLRGVYPYPKHISSWILFCVLFSLSDEDSTCEQQNVQLSTLTR